MWVVLGTRPEAIKLAPVVLALRRAGMPTRLVVTGQHRHLVHPALESFGLVPDEDLEVEPGPDLARTMARLLDRLAARLAEARPARVMVHGDTATTVAATLAAFYAGIPVAHVEAGLRTGELDAPFPEEANRLVVDRLATWWFAPTAHAAETLLAEGCESSRVHVTGNTAVDAVLAMHARVAGRPLGHWSDQLGRLATVGEGREWAVVTAHRRESIPEGLRGIAEGIRRLARRRPDMAWIVLLHPNPAVREVFLPALEGIPEVYCLDPLTYDLTVRLIGGAAVVLTDSGGLQEEAPTLGVPVVVLRDQTERIEGVAAGWLTVCGTEPEAIVTAAEAVLHERRRGAPLPFGDGRAALRIVEELS